MNGLLLPPRFVACFEYAQRPVSSLTPHLIHRIKSPDGDHTSFTSTVLLMFSQRRSQFNLTNDGTETRSRVLTLKLFLLFFPEHFTSCWPLREDLILTTFAHLGVSYCTSRLSLERDIMASFSLAKKNVD